MASKEELNNQQALNKEKQRGIDLDNQAKRDRGEQVNLSYSLVESLKESLGIKTKVGKADTDLLKVNKDINKAITERSNSFSSISSLQKEIAKSNALILKSDVLGQGLAKSVTKERQADLGIIIKKYGIAQNNQKLLDDENAKLSRGEEVNQGTLDTLQKNINLSEGQADYAMKNLGSIEKQYIFNKLQSEELAKQVGLQEDMEDSLGVAGGFADLIGKIPGLGGFASDALSEVTEEMTAAADAGEEMPTKMETMAKLTGKVGTNLVKKMLDPFTLIVSAAAMLMSLLKGSDKAAGELAKGMNMSYGEAQKMRGELRAQSQESDSIFSSTENLQESLMAINSTLGTRVMLNKEDLETFTKLREAAGFTNEELMGMQAITLATGTSLEENTHEFLAQANHAALANGVLLNEKSLMKDIGNVSAATTLSFGKNPGLIAQAVATTKALGMEMSKVEGLADSLLDFESSIEAELSAELLLGKNINLEKARQAALNNDLAGVAREISEQAGSAAEFGEMNRIQQEALAKAVGMSREDLGKTLFVQEQLAGATGEQAEKREKLLNARIAEVGIEQAQKELQDGSLENLEAQASVSERMDATMSKIKDSFMSIADAILQIVDPIVNVLSPILSSIATVVGYIVEGFISLAPALIPIMAIMTRMWLKTQAIAIMGVIKGAWQSLGGLPVVGPALAIAAIAGGVGYIKSQQKVADGIAPSSKGPFTITDNYGAMATTTKGDSLMASPNVGKAESKGNTIIDNSEGNKLLAQIAKGLQRQKPVPLYQITRS